MLGSASAQSARTTLPQIKAGAHTSFAPLKQINAGLLNIAYGGGSPAAINLKISGGTVPGTAAHPSVPALAPVRSAA